MLTYEELINNINILLADDDEDYLLMTYEFLKQKGYNVDTVTDGAQAIEKLKSDKYQIALLDYFMPNFNGEEVINEIRKTNKELIIILQTGFSGQKPPIETMKKLNIQNYFDKTEGIDRLNLELISAVKIFNQQNEIEFAKYKTHAIGNLMEGIAQEIKKNLLSVAAGMEVTNLMLKDASDSIGKENIDKLNNFYIQNKISLERIDKILNSIIAQAQEDHDNILSDIDVMDIIKLIITNDMKKNNIEFETNIALKSSSYLTGNINDNIFVLCEMLKKLSDKKISDKIKLVLTEDEKNWYFDIMVDGLDSIDLNEFLVLKKVIVSIRDTSLLKLEDKLELAIKKEIN